MKDKNSKNIFYIVLLVVVFSLVYVASQDITPTQERVENVVNLKLNK